MTATATKTSTVRELVPLLMVHEMDRSLRFYCDQLGFKLVHKWEPEGKIEWCRIERDGAALMLQQDCDEDGPTEGRGRGTAFYLICNDADAIFDELSRRGVNVRPPKVAFYGMNQLRVPDPDGYQVWFESRAENGKDQTAAAAS